MSGDLEQLTAADLMTAEVVTVEVATSLQDAVRLMVSKRIRHLPVMQRGKVIAMLSDRDVRMMVTDMTDPGERQRYMTSTHCIEHASSPVITATPGTLAQELAREFVESRIGCLPIVDAGGKLVGIVTHTDLLNWLSQVAG